jgi:RND family efflux transporter MFP subunit
VDRTQELKSLLIDRNTQPEEPPGAGRLVRGGLIGAGVLILAGGAYFFLSGSAPSAPGTGASKVAAADPAPGNAPSAAPAATPVMPASGLVASGYVVARRVATVSAEITGRVLEVLVEEGMRVEAGQILARLDSTLVDQDLPLARANIQGTQADLDGTSAALAEAERVLARTKPLAERAAASQADLTSSESKVATLKAQRDKLRAQLEISKFQAKRTEEQVAKYVIHAPFSGVVTEKSAQPGEIISPLSTGGFTRTGICTIVDMDSLEFEVDVNESNIGRVSAKQSVEAVLDAYPDWKIPASVIAIIPTANRDKAAIKVRIAINVKDPRILPNMAAKVRFVEKRTNG